MGSRPEAGKVEMTDTLKPWFTAVHLVQSLHIKQ